MARSRSRALGGPPKTFRKASWYSGMAAIRAMAASRLGWPISTGLTIGSAACSQDPPARAPDRRDPRDYGREIAALVHNHGPTAFVFQRVRCVMPRIYETSTPA